MLAQCVGQSIGTPQKHPAVPKIVSGGQKLSRFCQVRLFSEAPNEQGAIRIGCAGFNVSVTGFGTRGTDAEDDNVFSRCRDLNALAESFTVVLGVANYMVGWEKAEHRFRIRVQHQKCRQADGGRGITANRLGQDLFGIEIWQLPQDGGAKVIIGDNPLALGRSQGHEAGNSLLDHGLLAVEREQLLGAAFAAERPETGAASAGEDNRIEVRVRLHVLQKPNI